MVRSWRSFRSRGSNVARALVAAALVVCAPRAALAQFAVPAGKADPAHCQPGQLFVNTASTTTLKECGPTDTWVAVGAGAGSVSSVALTVPSFLSVSGSPITTSGTFAVTLANESAHLVFAGPSSGSPAAPTFRAIAAGDLPWTLNGNTTVLATISGSTTSTHCPQFDASGNLVDSGAACGSSTPGSSSPGDVLCNVSSVINACETGVFTYSSHTAFVNTIKSNIASALTIAAGTPAGGGPANAGNNLVLSASNAAGASLNATGGSVTVTAGSAFSTGTTTTGGGISLTSGNGAGTSGIGGPITFTTGRGTGGGGGPLTLTTAVSATASDFSGSVLILTGDSFSTTGGSGSITIRTGLGSTHVAAGTISVLGGKGGGWSGTSAAGPGGPLALAGGDGGDGSGGPNLGGAGATASLGGGTGGTTDGSTNGTAGAGGPVTVHGGDGGPITSGVSAGAGASLTLRGGNGGNATAVSGGTRQAGNGADLILQAGAPGTGAVAGTYGAIHLKNNTVDCQITDGGGSLTWGTGCSVGGGTVTHTAGTLDLNKLVVGNGTADAKVTNCTDGQVPIGSSSDSSVSCTTLTAGTNVTITNAGHSITIAASGGASGCSTSGSSILQGNGSGGCSNVTIGTGLTFSGGTLASSSGSGAIPGRAMGRLTLTSGTPVTTSDVTGATTVYWAPYNGSHVSVYTSSTWTDYSFTQISLALGTLTSGKNYDVFLYDSGGGTLALILGPAWSSDTTRGTGAGTTEITTQDGAWVNANSISGGPSAKAGLYLGTLRTTSTTACEDSAKKRFLFNAYNQVRRSMAATSESTASWNYTTATYRQANANTANQLDYVDGLGVALVEAAALGGAKNNGGGSLNVSTGVGVDSTSTNSALTMGNAASNIGGSFYTQSRATYVGTPGLGRHFLAWLEFSEAAATTTWFGRIGTTPIYVQYGITGTVWD